jgi:hypothetical protein
MLGRDDLIEAARLLWGAETSATRKDMRFGQHGSKKIELEGLLWSDFEAGEYGGVVELCRRAGNTQNLGNGSGSDGAWITYDYRDERQTLLFQVVKRPDRPRPERFIQRQPNGSDWIWNTQGVRRVLYRLPELIQADPNDPVFLCEGEKDVDNLRRLGCVATTNPGGAGKWRSEYNEFLDDADVILLPDNDKAGREHVEQVRKTLAGERSFTIVNLPGLHEGGDVSDWIGRGGTKEELLTLVARAREGKPHPPYNNAAELMTETFAALKWVVPRYVPEGCTLLSGKPKVGKSWLALAIVLACVRAEQVLGETCPKRRVLYCALEDNKRRLHSRIQTMLGDERGGLEDFLYELEIPRLDKGCVGYLRQRIETDQIGGIIIDTLAAVGSPKGKDETQNAADYRNIAELTKLTRETGVWIIIIHHLRKQGSDDVFEMISGTLGIAAAADHLMVLTREGDALRLATRGRDAEPEDKLVDFDSEMGEWTVTGDYEPQDKGAGKTREHILAALGTEADTMTPAQVAKMTGIKLGTVQQTLRRMARDGQVKRTSYGSYHV